MRQGFCPEHEDNDSKGNQRDYALVGSETESDSDG
jgi:hypothetical protein